MLPALVNGPGRDEEAADAGGFSLRSLPALLLLPRGEMLGEESGPAWANGAASILTSQGVFWSQSLSFVGGRWMAETRAPAAAQSSD